MKKRRTIGLVFGISIFLAAFGVALGATVWQQVTRKVPAKISFVDVKVLPDEKLGLYFDREAKKPVTSLNFRVLNLKPPLLKSRGTDAIDVYIRDETGLGIRLIEPCRDIVVDGQRLGHVQADIFDMEGRRRGHTCDRPAVRLAPKEMVRASVHQRSQPESGAHGPAVPDSLRCPRVHQHIPRRV